MIKRIILENFMSHGRTVIEPGRGLTLLVGPNNCGKSAVVEALRVLCRNLPGEVVVRHGQKLCRVVVETDDGHVIAWQRKGKSVRYEIDGKVDDRPGRSVPEGLHDALRLPEVETAGDSFDIHFGMQKSPLFLLGEKSESKIAAFFASSSDAEKLMEMQAKHREKVRNARQRLEEDEESLERSSKKLGALAPVEGIGPVIEAVEGEFAGIGNAERKCAELAGLLDDVDQATVRRDEWAARRGAVGGLQAPPAMKDVTGLERWIGAVEGQAQAKAREGKRLEAVSRLGALPVLVETVLLESVIANYQRTALQSRSAGERLRATIALAAPPALDDSRPLERACESLEAARRLASAASARSGRVGALTEPPELKDPAPLERLLGQWNENRTRATALALDVVDADSGLAAVEQEVAAWARRNPTCPLCGGVIEAEKVLEREHTHA